MHRLIAAVSAHLQKFNISSEAAGRAALKDAAAAILAPTNAVLSWFKANNYDWPEDKAGALF